MFTLICVWINGWVNNHEAGDLRRYRVHYDVIVMKLDPSTTIMSLRTKICKTIWESVLQSVSAEITQEIIHLWFLLHRHTVTYHVSPKLFWRIWIRHRYLLKYQIRFLYLVMRLKKSSWYLASYLTYVGVTYLNQQNTGWSWLASNILFPQYKELLLTPCPKGISNDKYTKYRYRTDQTSMKRSTFRW